VRYWWPRAAAAAADTITVVRKATGGLLNGMTLPQVLSIGAMVVSLTAWAVRAEGRIDSLQRQHVADVATLKEQQDRAIRQTRDDIAYIRERLDQVLDTRRR
jgi:hypothetical protein